MPGMLHKLRSRFATTVALLLITAALLALTVHRAVDEHLPGQSCEMCINLDRLGHGLAPHAVPGSFVIAFFTLLLFAPAARIASAQPAALHCRAPPASLFI